MLAARPGLAALGFLVDAIVTDGTIAGFAPDAKRSVDGLSQVGVGQHDVPNQAVKVVTRDDKLP
jgi:hypothetical protein